VYLRQEIELVKPKIILAVGAIAMRYFEIKGGIKKNSGKVFQTPFGPVIPVLHPAGLMRRMSDTPQFATQFAAINTFLRGGSPPPPYLDEVPEW
jgi:uracil-DNA glycosylase family 4